MEIFLRFSLHCSQTWTSHPLRRARKKKRLEILIELFPNHWRERLQRPGPPGPSRISSVSWSLLLFATIQQQQQQIEGGQRKTQNAISSQSARTSNLSVCFLLLDFSLVYFFDFNFNGICISYESEREMRAELRPLFVCVYGSRWYNFCVFGGEQRRVNAKSIVRRGKKRERENRARRVIVKCEENKANNQIEK